MGVREEIEKLTPGLRRYARALVSHNLDGRGEVADEIVHDTLLRVLATERSWRDGNLRIGLYSTFTQIHHGRLRDHLLPDSSPNAPGARSQGVTDALDGLGADEREALLLVVLEGFNYSQAADILNIPRAILVARIARARQSLGEHLEAAWPFESRARNRHAQHLRVVK